MHKENLEKQMEDLKGEVFERMKVFSFKKECNKDKGELSRAIDKNIQNANRANKDIIRITEQIDNQFDHI